MSNKNLTIGLVLAIVIAVGGYLYPSIQKTTGLFGSTACSSITCLSGGLRLVSDAGGDFESDIATVFNLTFKIGSSGTVQSNQVTTSCAMKANISIAATSSGYAFCTGLTGVTSADNVIAQFASSTGVRVLNDNWVILGAKASTTAGAVDFTLMNLTGAAAIPSAVSQQGSTTAVIASH